MGGSNLAGGVDSEGILLELKTKVQVLETSVKSCTKRLKEFQRKNRTSLLQQAKKIQKLTSKLKSVRVKLKEGKSGFNGLEKKLEDANRRSGSLSEGAESNRKEFIKESSTEAEDKEKENENENREIKKVVVRSDEDDEESSQSESSSENFCKDCENEFESQESLQIHRLHLCPALTDTHGCPVCLEYFGSTELLLQHLQTHESESAERISRRDEERTEGGNPKYQCRTCGTAFGNPTAFRRHLNFVHPDAASHGCGKCERVFASSLGFQKHERIEHEGIPRIHPCPKCGFTFARASHFSRHMKMCRARDLVYKCQICESSFYNMTAWKFHSRQEHSEMFTLRCTICSTGFKERFQLTDHEKRHSKPTPHRCGQCRYYFFKRMDLVEHERFCGTSVSLDPELSPRENISRNETSVPKSETIVRKSISLNSSQLARKIKKKALKPRKTTERASNQISSQPPTLHTCKSCGKEFSLKSSLTRHEKTHNKVILATAQKYGCKFCKEAFPKWFHFTEHVKTHSESHGVAKTLPPPSRGKPGLKKWKCLHCEKEFSGPETMQSHFIYTHAWRKPHECKSCQRSFCSSDGLKRHSKAHEDFQDPDYQEDEYE